VTSRPQDLASDPVDPGVRFWQETEAAFFAHLGQLRQALSRETDERPVRASWHRCLVRAADLAFEGFCGSCGNGFVAATDPRRVALAWKGLQKNLSGPKMLAILDLPAAERGAAQLGFLPLEGDAHEPIHFVS